MAKQTGKELREELEAYFRWCKRCNEGAEQQYKEEQKEKSR
jgi:hypothetical protein